MLNGRVNLFSHYVQVHREIDAAAGRREVGLVQGAGLPAVVPLLQGKNQEERCLPLR